MKKSNIIALVVIIAIVIVGGVYFCTPVGKKLFGKSAATVEQPQYSNYVFIPDLIRLAETNSQGYNTQYAGQTVQTTLKFRRYDIIPQSNTAQGQYGRYVAEFSYGAENFRQYRVSEVVKCYFNGDNAEAFGKLSKGQIVTLSGTCIEKTGFSMYTELELKDCKILKVHSTPDTNVNIQMFKIAADNGGVSAMFRLGYLYSQGLGVPTDYKSAAKWYRKAAELGSSAALNNLGELYRNGQGVPKDLEKAFKLYTLAADRGEAVAMCNLGELYEFGGYVSQDYNKAREWYQKSFEHGFEKAEISLKRVLGK